MSNFLRRYTRPLSYLLCLSMAGCCGMCKKGAIECNSAKFLTVRVERKDAGQIVDTLTVQVVSDSSMFNTLVKFAPPQYVKGFVPPPGTSYQQIDLSLLTPNYAYSNEFVLALRRYRFRIYVRNQLIASIDDINTGIFLTDDCSPRQCARIVSFRENNQVQSTTYNYLIRY